MTKNFLIEAQDFLNNFDSENTVVIDARTPEAYAKEHIPGAVFLTTYGCFVPDSSPAGMQAFADDVAKRYADIGVSHDKPVVVYEDATGMRAARELWILEYLGHKHVRMLHGGMRAWQLAGGLLDNELVSPRPTVFIPIINDEIVICADEINRELGQSKRKLIDVRDSSEFNGLDHTECCARRGHVPGAIWLEWTEFLEDGKYKKPEDIRSILASRGVDDQDELVPYCHRGARSANAYLAMRYAGYPNTRNFIGSMHDWSANLSLNIEK